MSRRTTRRASAAVTALALFLFAQGASAQGYRAPRASDGNPDLQGVWTNASLTVLERPPELSAGRAFSEAEAARIEARAAELNATLAGGFSGNEGDRARRLARVAGEPRTSFITSPANGRIPPVIASARARPPFERQVVENLFDNPESLSLDLRCIMPYAPVSGPVMLPSLANSLYQIVQTREAVAISTELFHDVRIIPIGAGHGPLPRWMGDSVGRWEGEELVVETVGFHPEQSLYGADPSRLKVTERFSRVAPDRLLYRFTLEDPTTWDRPWSGEYEFSATRAPLYEYACHEGNRFLPDLLAAERARE